MTRNRADEVLAFWFDEVDRARWFKKDPAFDREIAVRFGSWLEAAKRGELETWRTTARGCLALIVLLDQFSRNIHRGEPAAFAADSAALDATLRGIEAGFDTALTLEQRSFFYMPLMHCEDLSMQRLSLDKTHELVRAGYGSDKFARAHLEIIERFGRFPHRNAILGRASSPEEAEYLEDPRSGF